MPDTSTTTRTSEWRASFLDHFNTVRKTTQPNNGLDAIYSTQRTDKDEAPTSHLRTNASRESSPVFIVQSRESSPVFHVSFSRDTTPGMNPGTSRESTPATYSRESTPVLSLDMNDPLQAATAMAWLETAVRNVDSSIDAEQFKNLVAVPLGEEPAMERERLYSQVGDVDESLAGALRIVLDTVEWGGESGNSSSLTIDAAASGAWDTKYDS
jgi:hypothetical protein